MYAVLQDMENGYAMWHARNGTNLSESCDAHGFQPTARVRLHWEGGVDCIHRYMRMHAAQFAAAAVLQPTRVSYHPLYETPPCAIL